MMMLLLMMMKMMMMTKEGEGKRTFVELLLQPLHV